MSKNKTVRKMFFAVFCLFVCISLVRAESCSSLGQVQYKPNGYCGTSQRTCCLNRQWSDWDGECSKENMCSSFSGCKENWVLKNNASEIEGNTVEQCCSCNGSIYKGDCYEDLDSDYTSVGTVNVVYSWEVAYYKYNLEFQCGNEPLCYERDYYCKIKPVQFYEGGKMILEKGDANASYNHIWCGQDLGHPQGTEDIWKWSGGNNITGKYPVCDWSKSCYDICGKSGSCNYRCVDEPGSASEGNPRYYTSDWAECPEITVFGCDDEYESAEIYECSR